MTRHAVKIALFMGLALSTASCGVNDELQAELNQCQSECEQRMNSPQCRIGGPNICLCHCELRQATWVGVASDGESVKNTTGPLEGTYLTGEWAAYSGSRTPARLSVANAGEIASAVWGSAAMAYGVAMHEGNAGGASTPSLDFNWSDGLSGTTYLLEGYRVIPSELPGDTDLSLVSGRLYHPTHGYVDLSTMVPLHIEDPDGWPSSGAIAASSEDREVLILSAFSDSVYQVVLEQAQQ